MNKNYPEDVPEHVIKEFEDGLDDHIQKVKEHLDKKEKEHKNANK